MAKAESIFKEVRHGDFRLLRMTSAPLGLNLAHLSLLRKRYACIDARVASPSPMSEEKRIYIGLVHDRLASSMDTKYRVSVEGSTDFLFLKAYFSSRRSRKYRTVAGGIRGTGSLPSWEPAYWVPVEYKHRGSELSGAFSLTVRECVQQDTLLRKARLSGHVRYAVLANLHAERVATRSEHGVEDVSPQPKVRPIEEFQGFVEKIEEDKAYVRLDSQRGERLCGPYPARELTALGIGERDRFILRTFDLGRDVRIEVTPIPRPKFTAERQREIEEETERALGRFRSRR